MTSHKLNFNNTTQTKPFKPLSIMENQTDNLMNVLIALLLTSTIFCVILCVASWLSN